MWPLSPIYGFGAMLLTVALGRLYDKSFVIIFLASAVIGGGLEFLVSWFLRTTFGITAQDCAGTFLSFDGRANGFFVAVWGVPGLVFIKFMLPLMKTTLAKKYALACLLL